MGPVTAIGKQLQHPKGVLGKLLFRGMARTTIEHARWTAELMDLNDDDSVLEVGFGNGANIALLADRVPNGRVVGVEVSETALEMGTKRNADAIAAGRVELHLAPGGDLPFDDAGFDKACTVATMYVIEDPGAIFAEMHRVLRPGGSAAVTFPVRENFMRFKPATAEGFHLHELADLESAFRAAGFADARIERNDDVRFGAHCLLGHRPASTATGL